MRALHGSTTNWQNTVQEDHHFCGDRNLHLVCLSFCLEQLNWAVEGPGSVVTKHQGPKFGKGLDGNDRRLNANQKTWICLVTAPFCAVHKLQYNRKTLEFGTNKLFVHFLIFTHSEVKLLFNKYSPERAAQSLIFGNKEKPQGVSLAWDTWVTFVFPQFGLV